MTFCVGRQIFLQTAILFSCYVFSLWLFNKDKGGGISVIGTFCFKPKDIGVDNGTEQHTWFLPAKRISKVIE